MTMTCVKKSAASVTRGDGAREHGGLRIKYRMLKRQPRQYAVGCESNTPRLRLRCAQVLTSTTGGSHRRDQAYEPSTYLWRHGLPQCVLCNRCDERLHRAVALRQQPPCCGRTTRRSCTCILLSVAQGLLGRLLQNTMLSKSIEQNPCCRTRHRFGRQEMLKSHTRRYQSPVLQSGAARVALNGLRCDKGWTHLGGPQSPCIARAHV